MVLFAFILGVCAIGWLVPQLLVPRLPGGMAVIASSVIALALGAGFVWLGGKTVDALGIEDADSAISRGFNAWKIMLLVAPASALQARRRLTGKDPNR